MEGKKVVVCVVLMSLIMSTAHIQVEALLCCPSDSFRFAYNICRDELHESEFHCRQVSGCRIFQETCPQDYKHLTLKSGDGAVNEYCYLGCATSVCATITTLQHSESSQIVNGAVEQCTKACAAICAKGYTNVAVPI